MLFTSFFTNLNFDVVQLYDNKFRNEYIMALEEAALPYDAKAKITSLNPGSVIVQTEMIYGTRQGAEDIARKLETPEVTLTLTLTLPPNPTPNMANPFRSSGTTATASLKISSEPRGSAHPQSTRLSTKIEPNPLPAAAAGAAAAKQ